MTSEASLPARKAAWTDYWASGALHSCPGSYAGNYGGAIGAYWDRHVASLPEGARILDIATGNGALPLRILERHGDGVEIDAIDLAQPVPEWYRPERHPRIRFHGGVDMAATRFRQGRFDAVCSQFGIEYGGRPAALDEALRVLRPDGRLLLVVHHAASELLAVARAEADAHAWLVAEGGLLASAARMVHWLRVARSGQALPPEAGEQRQRYNLQVRELGARHGDGRARGLAIDVVQAVHGMLSNAGQGRADEAEVALAGYRRALANAQLRRQELLAHALSAEDVHAWLQRIERAMPTATVRSRELRQQEGVLAWALEAGTGLPD